MPDTTGIDIVTAEIKDLRVFPNPTEGEFDVSVNLSHPDNLLIGVYDVLGKLIEERSVQQVKNDVFNFDFSDKAKGVYYVKLRTTDRSSVKKLVLSR
jgi:hypothetical protein